jgi:hypothetical protein
MVSLCAICLSSEPRDAVSGYSVSAVGAVCQPAMPVSAVVGDDLKINEKRSSISDAGALL